VTGIRATQKALLMALLEPVELLKGYEEEGDYFRRLVLLEEMKSMPWGAVWDGYYDKNRVMLHLSRGVRWDSEPRGTDMG